ncbi:MAG TPA: hypothetical protein VMT34_12365 [Aggregatilineales bacterium]|nr:hypothetical protein [Aggregatilineales bacterium]
MPRRLMGCISVIAVFVAVVIIAIALLGYRAINSVLDPPNNFMAALQDGKYEAAAAYCQPDVQSQLCSPGSLQALLGGAKLTSWSQDTVSVQDNSGQIAESVSLDNGQTGTLTISLNRQDGAWHIDGLRFTKSTGR